MIPCLKTIYFIINLPRFQKTGKKKKKVHWGLEGGMNETQFSSKFGAKLGLACPFFS